MKNHSFFNELMINNEKSLINHFLISSQHRLMVEAEKQQAREPAHIENIMKSGFTMNDIKGLHRFGEDGAEADDMVVPSRPPRKPSLNRGSPTFDMMTRSASAFEIDGYDDDKNEKKRGRSPFKKFFKKNRDQSKDKHKSKSPPDRNRGRGTCKHYEHHNLD